MPAGRHRVEETIDRSRFICTVERVESAEAAQAFIREMNAEFADATHNCWAYVAGPPGSTTHIGLSDAGEPHGTAGRPMLTVLLHSDVGEIAAVVTRYYGGIKLGTGGLVKAYSGAVQLALETLPVAVRVDTVDVEIIFGYAHVTPVRQLLNSLGAEITQQTLAADVSYVVRIGRDRVPALTQQLADISRGEALVLEHQ